MKAVERDITPDEKKKIYDNFTEIEIALGIPQTERVRYSYVAKENGEIIGYASGITNHKWFCLTDMWVKAEYRRKGIGTKLLYIHEDKLKKIGIRHIYTWMMSYDNGNDYTWTIGCGNEHFYNKLGYFAYTVIENFFETDGIHHVGYRKDLSLEVNDIPLDDTLITDNEITRAQHKHICELVKQEIQDNFPPRKQAKYSYVFEENGRVVAYAAGYSNCKWFVLTDMWVKTEYRRRVLGSRLLLFLEEKVKEAGVRHVYTWTMGQNNAQYYESLGYKCFTVLENFFEIDGMDHIGYRKDF